MIEDGVRVAFYRGIMTFWLAEVGGGSKSWSNGGFDEMKMLLILLR